MDIPNILDSLIILVILSCSISPSCEIDGADDLIQVIHHLVGEFGGKEGDCGPIMERVPCFIGQGFKFGNESISITPGVKLRWQSFSSARSMAPVSWNDVSKALVTEFQ